MATKLEVEFVDLEIELQTKLEQYKELCERMGFNFVEHAEDLIDIVENRY